MTDIDRLQNLLTSDPAQLTDLVNDPVKFLNSHGIGRTDEILSRIELLKSAADLSLPSHPQMPQVVIRSQMPRVVQPGERP